MRVSTMLDSIFGVPKKLSIIFRGQQRNSGMDPPVLKVREYPPWGSFARKGWVDRGKYEKFFVDKYTFFKSW